MFYVVHWNMNVLSRALVRPRWLHAGQFCNFGGRFMLTTVGMICQLSCKNLFIIVMFEGWAHPGGIVRGKKAGVPWECLGLISGIKSLNFTHGTSQTWAPSLLLICFGRPRSLPFPLTFLVTFVTVQLWKKSTLPSWQRSGEGSVGCTVLPEISLWEKSSSRAQIRKNGPRTSSASLTLPVLQVGKQHGTVAAQAVEVMCVVLCGLRPGWERSPGRKEK